MSIWSKRKRLEATIAGEPADRLPVALWRHWPGDDQDAAALARAQLDWQSSYDWDLVKVGPASNYSVADWGVQDRWLGHIEGTRQTTHQPIHRPQDWAQLKPLDPGKGALATQIEALRLIREALGATTPMVATVFSVLAQAKHLAGSELLSHHMRSDPESLHQGLNTIAESTLRFVDAAIAAGIDGVYYAVQHARYPLLSRDEFGAFGRPYDLRILEAAADLWLNIVHLHGNGLMFDLVADYPVPLFNWHDREADYPLARGLQHIAGAASGGVDHWTLHQESPAEALAEAQDALQQTGSRRLLLGTGCVIMVTTPTRNIRALREFVERA